MSVTSVGCSVVHSAVCAVVRPLIKYITTGGARDEPARLGTTPADYARLGITREIQIWEDALRTTGDSGSYEWWYADGEFEDGSKVVVVFFTKNRFDVPGPAHPTVIIDIDLANGESLYRTHHGPKGSVIQASKRICDVRVDGCHIRAVGDTYEVVYDDGVVRYEATMESLLPAHRPETGYSLFGPRGDRFFAWFIAQPLAEVHATLTIEGREHALIGKGYHDHNWGNVGIQEVMNHWYWGRAKVGPYHLIFADIIAEERYRYTRMPALYIARDGAAIPITPGKIHVRRSHTHIHPETGKFFDDVIVWSYTSDDGTEYEIEIDRQADLTVASLLDDLPPLQRMLAQLACADPTYIRATGDVFVTVRYVDGSTEAYRDKGIWEQMFLGSEEEPPPIYTPPV